MTDIVFTRTLLTQEQMYGDLAGIGASEPSLGLCYLSAQVREKGFRVKIIDALAEGLTNEKLADQILQMNPKYVGISSVTISIYDAASVAEIVKEKNSNIKIIVGGAHMTAVPFETMEQFPQIDIGVIGEGEVTIVELMKALDNNTKLDNVSGIVFRNNGRLKVTGQREFINDLDLLPMPAWDLLPPMSFYSPPAWSLNKSNAGLLVTSRGCANNCTFCDRSAFGRRYRSHSAGYVMKMIRHLYDNYNIRHFRINDDNFILFKKRLYEICDILIKNGPKISWSCFARVDGVNPELLKLMKQAGCWQISYGVETACQEIHNIEKKNITIEQIEKAIIWTHRAGIKTIAFCMIGHPLETTQTIRKTINFVKRLPLDDFKMMYITPYPGTELYRDAEKYGTINRDWRMLNSYQEPPFVPYGLTKEQIVVYRNKAFKEFYLQPRIILSYLLYIRNRKQLTAIIKGVLSLLKLVKINK